MKRYELVLTILASLLALGLLGWAWAKVPALIAESDRREAMSHCKYGQKAPGGSYGCSCGYHR